MISNCSTTKTKKSRKISILPLGDSITQGGKTDRDEFTYRYPLYCMLKDANIDFKFIGSLTNGLQEGAAWPKYKGEEIDLHHEGHYGWKTAAVDEKIDEWMLEWSDSPDIALIHLGTNDRKADDFNKSTILPLESIINKLRNLNPNVVVLIGHLNFNDDVNATRLRPLVEKSAEGMTTIESPVITVHHYKGWIENPDKENSDTFDWAHPNPNGQKKMAKNWYEAMQPYLK
jgi:hypothetical protein